jgi:UDP-N-acetylmuramate--alanine ligase
MKRHVHLVGIGGAGLSAIARILYERGDKVTGSDLMTSVYSQALERDGVFVTYGHRAENVVGADVVVVSSAVPDDNVEVEAARRAGIQVLHRAAFLGELTAASRTIAVAGTHGKTTTTGLIAWLLDAAGLSPSFMVGGMVHDFGTNARAGGGKYFVIEADEYDRTFLGLRPSVAVVTNVEHDHPDCYPTPEDFRKAFETFARQVEDLLIVCLDDPGAASIAPIGVPRQTYGLSEGATWRADEIRTNAVGGSDFLVLRGGETLGLFRTRLPGKHNVLNILSALIVGDYLGLDLKDTREALTKYCGVQRRFEIIGEEAGVMVVDDYAHHPTEIRATLAAARQRFPDRELWAVFQPHTYSRTRTLMDAFSESFSDADHVILTDIFAARERADPKITGKLVADRIAHHDVHFFSHFSQAVEHLLQHIQPGSVVITLSAGDGNEVGQMLLKELAAREGECGDG